MKTGTPRATTRLPPGQRALARFPRFGTHLDRPPPAIPADPSLEISTPDGVLTTLPLTTVAALPRTAVTADFHCVSGWSATDLHWEGVAFATLYRDVIEPELPAGLAVTHVVFGGLDGFESLVLLEDALEADVLLADRLDGEALGSDHGAPLRLVSPQQYGYMSCKHLCRIELHPAKPDRELGAAHPVSRRSLRGPFVLRHPRARVWEEERHPWLPARLLRPFYRRAISVGIALGARHPEPPDRD